AVVEREVAVEVQRGRKDERSRRQRPHAPAQAAEEDSQRRVWLAGRPFDQSVQPIAGEHGNRELERDEVKEGVASEPEPGQQAVKPAMEGGKLAQAHEEAGERRGPEKARILSLAEQEPDQRQQQERSSHV